MKITFKNLGKIDYAECKLGNLTIIAGENNTGKTYLTYTLYGLLKKWKDLIIFPDIEALTNDILELGSVKMPLTKLTESLSNSIKSLSKEYSDRISEIFNDKENTLDKASIELEITDFTPPQKGETKINIGEHNTITGVIVDNSIEITLVSKNKHSVPPRPIIYQILNRIIAELYFGDMIHDTFISTSERIGISLFYKELDATKSALVGELQRLGKEKGNRFNPIDFLEKLSSWYAIPIKDNIDFTRAISKIQERSTSDFKDISDKIKDLLGGYFKHDGTDLRFISKARKNGRFDIPLYLASTSARGLSDLYFFLRYIADKDMVMIIDEPESHLSTANQIVFARIIANCVNAGLKVFLTTHSDYIIKELNNLVMLSNDFDGKKEFLKTFKNEYSEKEYLKAYNIKAYICENGGLTPCIVDNKGMEITSFDNTIEKINHISNELDFLTDNIQ